MKLITAIKSFIVETGWYLIIYFEYIYLYC